MKKRLSLFLAALLALISYSAKASIQQDDPEVIFSAVATTAKQYGSGTTEITADYATITGGKMYTVSEQTSDKELIKTWNKQVYFCQTNNNTYFKVVLDKALAVGDVITCDALAGVKKNNDGEITGVKGLWVSTADGYPSTPPACAGADANNETDAIIENLLNYTVTAGSEYVGATTLYIYRAAGATEYFTNFKITRPATVNPEPVETKTIYMRPGVWASSNDVTRYAVYAFNVTSNDNQWFDLAELETDEGTYSADIPENFENIILVRMDGTKPENSWDNAWNQTEDINFTQTADNTLFTIDATDWGTKTTPYTTSEYTGPEAPAQKYNVTVDDGMVFGTVEADKYEAAEGDQVALKVLVKEEYQDTYELDALTVTADGAPIETHEIVGSDYNYAFTMPAQNVTVSATFKEIAQQEETIWQKTNFDDLATGDIVVIVDQTSAKALPNGNGATAAPDATAVTLSEDKSQLTGDIADNIQWTVTKTDDGIKFGVGDSFLYCTNTNNGVRVGTNSNNVFTWKDSDNTETTAKYLYNNATSRYIGVYSEQDWRCYTSVNSNIKGTVTAIYKKVGESGGGGADDPVYIAAGDKAVWGSSWDAKDTNNQLTKDNDGKFSITKEDLNLAAGEYGYKIVKDGTWIPDGTGNDKKLSIAENGKYAVTLTVDPEAEADYLATATKTGEYVEPEPVYVAVGVKELWGVDAWTIAEENTLIKGNDGKYSITKENLLLPEGQYGYKIVKDGNTWIPDGTDNEKKLEITETAYYNVTLTVDPADVENYLATAEKAASINTIAEVQAAERDAEVTVQGIIYASAASGAVLYDGDDYLYYYNTKNALNIGQKVLMAGKVSKYGGASQLTAAATITDLGTVDGVVYPDPVELKAADFDAIAQENTETVKRQYVTYTGKLTISGNYYNIAIEGTTANIMASLVAPKEDISELNGKDIVVKGYMMYKTSNNQGQFAYTVATSVEEYVEIPTYTATFTTDKNWEKVYAYAWTGTEGQEGFKKFLGDWPGEPLTLNAETSGYEVTIKATEAPEFIIFNDGTPAEQNPQVGVNKTADLPFENGAAYTLTTEKTTAYVGDPEEAIPTATGIEIPAATCVYAGVQAEKIIRIVAKELAAAAPARGLDNTVTGDPDDIPFSIVKIDGETVLIADKDITVAEDLGEKGKAYEFTASADVAQEITDKGFVIKPKTEKNVAIAAIEVEQAKAPAPVADYVYDFAAEQALIAAGTVEKPGNVGGNQNLGQGFYGWEKSDKTDSKRNDYKGYSVAEGSQLPIVNHLWRRSDRYDQDASWANAGGLTCPADREYAIDGLKAGSKVVIEYDATNATEGNKEIIWAMGDGSSESLASRATATINGVEAVSGETAIASGAEIVVNTVTPAVKGTGYIVVKVKKDMIIKSIAIYDAEPYYAVNISNEITNGTVKANKPMTFEGDEVTLTATPAAGYKLDAITVTGATTNEAVVVTDGKFTMIADDVNVSATFEKLPDYVYDFAAEQALIAAGTVEKPGNVGGNQNLGQGFYGWEKSDKTDSKRNDYKGYSIAEGSQLPIVNHLWRRSDRYDQDASWANAGGLTCPADREYAIDGLKAGSKVVIEYDATNATEGNKEIIWAMGDGSSESLASRATATINGVEAVSGETAIASGAEIVVNTVTPAVKGTGYIVVKVKANMIIKSIAIYDAEPYYAVNISNEITNGTVKANKPMTFEGDEVTLTATANDGYELEAITVTGVTSNVAVPVTNGKFIMPADAVNVSATFVEKLEYYLVGNMTEWKPVAEYKLTANTAAEGEEYMITVDLAADAQFKILKSNGTTIDDANYYPQGTGNNYGEHGELQGAGKYTVYFRPNADGGDDWFYHVIFAQKFYNITVVNCDGMTITPEVTEATAGTKVWATVAMTEGYEPEFPAFTNTDTGDVIEMTEDTDVGMDETGKVWIIMPAQNLTITAKAAKVSQITLDLSQENGSATCISVNKDDPTTYNKKEGKEIYLNVTPDAGYTADITVTAGEDPVEVIAEAGTYHDQPYTHKFIMPAKDVTVKVTFTKSTGINGIDAEDADDNAPIYNLAGQKVDKNYKGVVIKNGKKIYQK